MKDERGKIIVYIKIMYIEPLLVFYTLRNTIATFEYWLNIENMILIDFRRKSHIRYLLLELLVSLKFKI
jgi:hypothetical protein